MFTIDTNILIYYAAGDPAVISFFNEHLQKRAVLLLPTIVIVEFLSFPKLAAPKRSLFEKLLPQLEVIPLEFDLSLEAAGLRRRYGLKLGDGVIAATALSTNSRLVTRNIHDFKKIPDLEIITL